MDNTIYIVGIGPGNPDYVVPRGLKLIREADVLVGSARSLEDFSQPKQITYPVTGKLTEMTEFIATHLKKTDVVVLVSGDPGYYSLLPYLKKQFPHHTIDVIAGISSMTYAFARLGEPWQNADLLSFHGRKPPEERLVYEEGKVLGFLTDKEYNPSHIAQILLEKGWPEHIRAAACERLSYEDERIARGTLKEISLLEGFYHSVLVVMG